MAISSMVGLLDTDAVLAGNTPTSLINISYNKLSALTTLRIWGIFNGFLYDDGTPGASLISGVIQIYVENVFTVQGGSASVVPNVFSPNVSISTFYDYPGLIDGPTQIDLAWWSFTDGIPPNHGIIECPAAGAPELWGAAIYVQEMTP